MKYFVTGATGFVGGRVVSQLFHAGHDVIALVRDVDKAKHLAALGATLAQGDVTDKESMRTPMTGVDGIFHIAGWYKVGAKDKAPASAINIDGTRNVLEVMKQLKIPKAVYTSSLVVNSDTGGQLVDENYRFGGRHISEYDRTKAVAHELAEQFIEAGLPLVSVQPGLIYGPGDKGPTHDAFVSFLTRQLPMVPKQTAYCWTHIDDAARGHLLAMEHGRPGENYFICGPVHSFIEVLKLAEQITGVPAPARTAPPWLMKTSSALMSVVERVVSVPDDYSSEYLRVTAGVTYLGSNAKAKKDLGWQPRSLKEGLADALYYEMELLGLKEPSPDET